MSESSSGNVFDETEESSFNQRGRRRKQLYIIQFLFTGVYMATIQSSTSEAESSLNAELLIELVRQFPVIWNPKLNYIKDHAKKKNAWIQISTVLGVLHCTNLFLAII